MHCFIEPLGDIPLYINSTEWLSSYPKGVSEFYNSGSHRREFCPGFCSMKLLRVLLHSLDGMLVHRRLSPAFYQVFSSPVPIYTPGWKEAL